MPAASIKKPNKLRGGSTLRKALASKARKLLHSRSQRAANDDTLGRLGSLEVRLARNAGEIRSAQVLRYKVFFKEMAAKPGAAAKIFRRDVDRLDPFCDHVLVLDHSSKARGRPRVVGTYRLLRQEVAERSGGFYSQDEFDITPLLERHKNLRFLELGRSCVLQTYRNKKTVELLWQGIWAYVLRHKLDVLIGCASFEGTDIATHQKALSYLAQHHSAPVEWEAKALPERYVEMDKVPEESLDLKRVMASLPPLVKGYLRLGAMIGKGAVIDRQFNMIDVLMILPVKNISEKYIGYFGADASRYPKNRA